LLANQKEESAMRSATSMLSIVVVFALAGGAFGAEAPTAMPLPQVWTGILEQPPASKAFVTEDIEVKILAFSSDREVQTLTEELRLGGQSRLRQAMFGMEQKAWVRIGRAAAASVGLVRVVDLPDGTRRMRLVSDFPARSLDSSDRSGALEHPFGLIELTVGPDGKAAGQMIAASSITLADGKILFESAGEEVYRIIDVMTDPPLR
jgi:hypothetical protein